VKYVACENHAQRQRPGKCERSQAVGAAAPSPGKRPEYQREDQRSAESADWSGKAESVRKHEAGKRRGPDRVRIEGEAAQDDPGPEQARPDRQQKHLEEAALDERELERRGQEVHRPTAEVIR
jgi:hypothetical protein